ncbi:MAG: LarC family nickel insertion protein [Hyphomicrobiales bacterium]|nr:LarC family nickel insertion protein [Hyphomicrobiales bacterium]MCP5371270.1 LarC family nickel insertion protein [Hyphomicrobiales bacterium]
MKSPTHGSHSPGPETARPAPPGPAARVGELLVIRPASGLSGDMLLAGLARMAAVETAELSSLATGLGLPAGCVALAQRAVNGINGWTCRVTLPPEHAHRTFADIRRIIADGDLTPAAAAMAVECFALLAEAEGRIHGVPTDKVVFHEVGALDSILDVCLACLLFDRIAPAALVCGPLPLCDGTARCAHGPVPTPAPAVLDLLPGVTVRGIDSQGETVTPTAISLLKGLGATFGPWPEMTVTRTALVYGTRVLPGVANGALFALGRGTVPA